MTKKQDTLGFIGIGLMGKPLTLRLLDAGFHVNVWNRSKEKLKPVVKKGATAFSSVAKLVKVSDIIILCLANSEAVEAIVTTEILDAGSADKLLIDLSSIDPETTKQLAKQLKQQCDMNWVDAPVSGGTSGAEQGILAIMAGGKS